MEFICAEYLNLWKDAGVEDLEHLEKFFKTGGVKKKKEVLEQSPCSVQKSGEEQGTFSSLDEVCNHLGDCHRCGLSEKRNKIVFGSGNPKAKLVFVGEGPGADEDTQGLPFVGRAGELLTKIIMAMGLKRDEVYIANVVKCRPPNNRAPEPVEIELCLAFLKAQIEVIQPRMIVCLGSSAALTLLGSSCRISSMRGKIQPLSWNKKIAVMPTFHPAYLLRNPAAKKLVWEDMKKVKAALEAIT